jgi:regulatory protein
MVDEYKQSEDGFKKKEQKKRLARKITESYLQNSGLYYLQRYAASEAHFKTIMSRKIDRSIIDHPDLDKTQCLEWLDEIAQKFIKAGYLNDERYATGLLQSLQVKGRSQKQIQGRMRHAGVAPDIIERVAQARYAEMAERIDASDLPSNWPLNTLNLSEYIAALKCARKRRIGPFEYMSAQPKPHDKALAMMARNGFSYDIAQTILATDKVEAEDIMILARSLF